MVLRNFILAMVIILTINALKKRTKPTIRTTRKFKPNIGALCGDRQKITFDTRYCARDLYKEFKKLKKNPKHKVNLYKKEVNRLLNIFNSTLALFDRKRVEKGSRFYERYTDMVDAFTALEGIEQKPLNESLRQLKFLNQRVDFFMYAVL
uniref:Uncharacterized protein n=1 Tax=Clastoptera arizonana TaxID=38151 RepID=A0A1B6ECA3_9HEMI